MLNLNLVTMRTSIKLSQDPKFAFIREFFWSPSNNQKSSDVTIFCEDGLYFAHKLVLASASDLLKTLFYDNFYDKELSLILPALIK